MARQKFLPTHKGKNWSLGPGVIESRPKLVQLIGECIALWPYIENDLALFLAGLLKANTRPVLSVFFTLRTGRVQREAMTAAVEATMDKTDQELVAAAFSVIGSAETARNDLAHGVWGVSEQIADALLWIEGKHLGTWNAEFVLTDGSPFQVRRDAIQKHLYVYRERDLSAAKQELEDAREVAFHLAMLGLWNPTRPGTLDEARHHLRTLAPIQKAIRQAAETREKREALTR